MAELDPMEIVVPEGIENDLTTPPEETDEEGKETKKENPEEETPENNNGEEENEGDEDEDEKQSDDTDDVPTEKTVRATLDTLQKEANGAAQLLSTKGLDYNAMVEEYKELGSLSKATRKSLADAGFSDDLVNGYIEGIEARSQVYADHVRSFAGGEKDYDALVNWAAKHLSPKEIEMYDNAVDSMDLDTAKFAIQGLKARMERETGVKPNLVRGKQTQSQSSVKGFKNIEEMAKAQDDPRYEVDEAYTRMVERRMLASNF